MFLVSQKFVIYKIRNTLKLFWFTIASSVLLNKEAQFFFHAISLFSFMTSVNISAHLSMKTILVNPNLECTFFGNKIFDSNNVAHP